MRHVCFEASKVQNKHDKFYHRIVFGMQTSFPTSNANKSVKWILECCANWKANSLMEWRIRFLFRLNSSAAHIFITNIFWSNFWLNSFYFSALSSWNIQNVYPNRTQWYQIANISASRSLDKTENIKKIFLIEWIVNNFSVNLIRNKLTHVCTNKTWRNKRKKKKKWNEKKSTTTSFFLFDCCWIIAENKENVSSNSNIARRISSKIQVPPKQLVLYQIKFILFIYLTCKLKLCILHFAQRHRDSYIIIIYALFFFSCTLPQFGSMRLRLIRLFGLSIS